jgi:hypothetical protein
LPMPEEICCVSASTPCCCLFCCQGFANSSAGCCVAASLGQCVATRPVSTRRRPLRPRPTGPAASSVINTNSTHLLPITAHPMQYKFTVGSRQCMQPERHALRLLSSLRCLTTCFCCLLCHCLCSTSATPRQASAGRPALRQTVHPAGTVLAPASAASASLNHPGALRISANARSSGSTRPPRSAT